MNKKTILASTSTPELRAIPPCPNGGIPHYHCGVCGKPTTHTISGDWHERNIKALCSGCAECISSRMRERIKAHERRLWCTIVGAEGRDIG